MLRLGFTEFGFHRIFARCDARNVPSYKLMERLEDKGYVKHSRQRGVLVFTALVSREELLNRRLREVAGKLCGGSLTPLVMNLVRAEPLTGRELDELQAFINEQRRRGKPKDRQS